MTAAVSHDVLQELAGHFGIATEFTDWLGEHREVSDETLISVLGALDVDASSDDLARTALAELANRRWRHVVPPTVVTRVGESTEVLVHVPDGASVQLAVELEEGGRVELEQLGEIGPGWEYYLDQLVASKTGAALPDFNDYYPAQREYYADLASEAGQCARE